MVAAVAVLSLVGLAQAGPGATLLRSLGLSTPPARYTELAFASPEHLPIEPLRPRESVVVPFTLHNVEGRTQAYDWSVVTRTRDAVTVVARGRTTLASGAATAIAPRILPPCGSQRMRVTVQLNAPRQAVGFWRDCAGRNGRFRG